jgi:hypothetical protein
LTVFISDVKKTRFHGAIMDCRICVLNEPHVHISETRLELAQVPPDGFAFHKNQVQGIDFALPAVKQEGSWWICTHELVELVWPRWKAKIVGRQRRVAQEIKLGLRPEIDEGDNYEEQDQT